MAKFIPVEPEKWAEMVKAQAEVERLKADVNELADGLKLASEVGIKMADEVTRLKAEVERLEKEVWRMKVFKGIDEDTKTTLKDALNTVPEWAKVLETIESNARLETEKIALKAEVERLTNELEKQDLLLAMANAFVTDWNAAKNGNFNETKSPGFIEDLGNGVEKHDLKFRVPPVVKNGGQP